MKKTLFILLTILLTFTLSCKEEKKSFIKKKKEGKSVGIILTPNTSVRISPFIFSGRVDLLEKGSTAEILDKSFSKSYIGKSIDYWYKVKTERNLKGWVFGKNLKILSSGTKDAVIDFVSEFWEEESDEMKKELAGKWWSINSFGEYTSHCIELYKDGTYLSYWKGRSKKAKKGEYNLNFNKSEILFLGGGTFGNTLKFARRGRSFIFIKEKKEYQYQFKKIASEKILDQANKEKNKKEKEEKKKNKGKKNR